jgi:Fibronectin type III domain
MNQVALNLNTMTALEKASFAQNVASSLIANEGTFPDQPVPGADLYDFATAVKQALSDADAAKATWREMISAQNDMLATLEGYLRQTATYVGSVADGDAATIELAGLNARQPAARIGQLPAPTGLKVTADRNPGTITARWRVVRKTRNYIVQYAPGATLPPIFPNEISVTRTRADLAHLTSATRYWLRVAALGTAGPSNWTDVLSVVTQ